MDVSFPFRAVLPSVEGDSISLGNLTGGARMDRSWRRVVAMCLLIIGLQVVTPPAHSGAKDCQDRGDSAYAPATGAIFNDPTGEGPDQYRIIASVVKNIKGTPPGGYIRIATLAIQARSVVEALTAAHECRVHVRVLVPGRAWEDHAVLRLREALGSDESKDSYITRCNGSCTSKGSKGIMHVKSYQFSKVNGDRHVTIYSSSNLTQNQATIRWNDAYQVVGDEAVYSSAARFFDKLIVGADSSYRRLTKAAGYWQYSFPAGREFHLDLLEQTRCRTPSGPTTIRFMASIWKQRAVAEKIADLHDAGCVIRVLLNLDKMERPVLRTLLHRGVPTRVGSGDSAEAATHSKYLTIRGRHDGYIVRTVYCGSVNVSEFSTRTADNSMLRIVDDTAAHAAYRRNFNRVWLRSRPLRPADVQAAGEVDARAAELRD